MTPITLSLFLLVLASFGHCATAKASCMTNLLTLTGVSESNALAYSKNLALYGVTLGEFLGADDLTLRGLGVTSQDDRNRISDCRPPNSINTLHSAGYQTNKLRNLLPSLAELERQRLPRYRAFTDKVTWQEAGRRCATFGGGLAMVKNLEEQQEVYDIASHYQLSRFWLGASDQTIEGRWSWWDGTRLDYRNFSDREPNSFEGNEDCLEMRASYRNRRGVWNDLPCFVLRPFLCQFW